MRGLRLARLAVLPLDRLVHLLAVDRYLPWGLDSQPNLVAANIDNRHDNIVADHDALVALSG